MSVVFHCSSFSSRRSAPSRSTSDLTRITLSYPTLKISYRCRFTLPRSAGWSDYEARTSSLSARHRYPVHAHANFPLCSGRRLPFCTFSIVDTISPPHPTRINPPFSVRTVLFLGTKTEDSKMLLIRLRLVYEATHADRFIPVPRPSTRLLVSPAPLSLARCSSTSATKEATPATLLRSTSAPLDLSELLSPALGGRLSPGLLPQKKTKSSSPPKPAGLQTRLSSPPSPSPNRIKLAFIIARRRKQKPFATEDY